MRWAKTSLRNSFFGWVGKDTASDPPARLDEIRRAMLDALEQADGGRKSALERKLLFARDIEELWYTRPDLMQVLATARGESAAREIMAGISELFDGQRARRHR